MTESEDDLTAEDVSWLPIEEWGEKYERPRGMLAKVDRQFLWGLKEYAHDSTVSDRRGDIRERVGNGLLDLFYLTKLTERSRNRIFNNLEERGGSRKLRESVAALVQFLYLGVDGDLEWVEETIALGISNAEKKHRDDDTTYYSGASADAGVNVDIEVTRGYDVDEIEDRFRSGGANSLTPAEVGVLVRQGRVQPDELPALDSTVRDRLDPATGEIEDPGPNPTFGNPRPSVQDQDDED